MGITKFFYLLLVFAIAIIFYDIDHVSNEKDKHQRPLVSFYDSIMYNINTENVKSIIPSKEAYFYKTKEEIYNGTIITRGNNKKDMENPDTIGAQSMVKIGNEIYLDGDVNLDTADGIHLKTEQLQYNLKTKVAQNEERFVATNGFYDFYGKNLYYDDINRYVRANYIHFNMKVEDE